MKTIKSLIIFFNLFCFISLFGELHLSELNPDFIEYLKNGHQTENFGTIPPPVVVGYRNLKSLNKRTSLPTVYDLRDSNWVTPIKNQGSCGSCWAFATMASIESNWLMNGYGEYDLSENNLKNGSSTGFYGPCDGGNAYRATAYFNRALGPILEIDDPYQESNETYYELPINHYIQEAQFLPAQQNYTDDELPDYITLLKNSILENGAHEILYFTDDNYYQWLDNNLTFYFPNETTTNHSVSIIGWNDTISTNATEKGAWLIKNSWGTDWGMNGCFYMSYYSKSINQEVAFWPKRKDWDESDYVYFKDDFGGYLWLTSESEVMYGLMKAELWNQNISHIATWAIGNGVNLNIEIYDDFENGTLENLLTTASLTNIENFGYYSVPVDSIINITEKNDVYIKIKYENNDENNSWFIPIETYYEGYIDPVISVGNDWISNDGENWYDSYDEAIDLAIKILGKYTGLQTDFEVSQKSPSPGDTIQFTDLTVGIESPTQWYWNFGDGGYSTEQNPYHIYDSEGIYTISLTVSSENFTESITKENIMYVTSATLISPSDESREYTTSPDFTWNALPFSNKFTYQLTIAENKEFTKNLLTFDADTANSLTLTDVLSDNTQYFWNIVAYDTTSSFIYNDTNTFIINIEDEAPNSFALKLPKNGATNLNTKVGFLWEETTDNDPYDYVLYRLKVDTTSDFIQPLYNIDSIAEYHYVLENELPDNYKYFWQVTAYDTIGLTTVSGIDSFVVGSITAIDDEIVPVNFELSQNYPNPFNPTTTIEYSLNKISNVELSIYNALGKKIDILINKKQNVGAYTTAWNGTKYSSGLYFCMIKCKTDDGNLLYQDVKKMLLIK